MKTFVSKLSDYLVYLIFLRLMKAKAEIEQALYEALKETDLLAFKAKLALDKQLTRLEHFEDVTDEELRASFK